MTKNGVFEEQYRQSGVRPQRSYPNEALIQFVARRWFSQNLQDRKKIKILEVGSGSGANLWMLAKEGFDAYGIDCSPSGIKVAREVMKDKWGVSAEMSVATFDQLPFGGETFDAVVDVVSLQHVPIADSYQILREIARVLKPGGAFFSYRLSQSSSMFTMAEDRKIDECTLENISNPKFPLNNNGTTSFWNEKLVREIYANCGFEVNLIDQVRRTYGESGYEVGYLAIDAEKVS